MSDALATPRWSVVVPSIGRPSLRVLLESLDAQDFGGFGPEQVVVVDDRPEATTPLDVDGLLLPVRVVRSGGRGPAAARNAGWRSALSEWVELLDDDVVLPAGWADLFLADLRSAASDPTVGATQGGLRVPLPTDRRPTDWERSTAGLEGARWATADMAYRRSALVAVDGFDERFPRAYREDADLALRVRRAGWDLRVGARVTTHPVRPAPDGVSLRVQAGARDDALMRALHGRQWRADAQTGRGRFAWHVATVASAATALGAWASGHRTVGALATTSWAALTADFFARRVAPGPRPHEEGGADEWQRMAWTSVAIPFAATWHRAAATWSLRRGAAAWRPAPRAVLFDRDGTLVHDVPYNGDPGRVEPVAQARDVLDALRSAGVLVALVTNQSGIARGLISPLQVLRVNSRLAELVGPFDAVEVCPHGSEEGCACRKPAGGMVLAAAEWLGVAPWECAVVGDIGADVGAAHAAGARAVLVPTDATRAEEVAAAPAVADDLWGAVELLLPDLAPPDRAVTAPRAPSSGAAA